MAKVDIDKIKDEIVERLLPFKPDKILLFGSYAYGKPTDESDIDLFLVKNDIDQKELRNYKLQLQKQLFDLQKKYLIGIDLFVDTTQHIHFRINKIKDQFYMDILSKGKVLYGK